MTDEIFGEDRYHLHVFIQLENYRVRILSRIQIESEQKRMNNLLE